MTIGPALIGNISSPPPFLGLAILSRLVMPSAVPQEDFDAQGGNESKERCRFKELGELMDKRVRHQK
jgi:hypothetical protein